MSITAAFRTARMLRPACNIVKAVAVAALLLPDVMSHAQAGDVITSISDHTVLRLPLDAKAISPLSGAWILIEPDGSNNSESNQPTAIPIVDARSGRRVANVS